MKKNLLLLLALFALPASAAVKINDQNINEITQPENPQIVHNPTENNTVISFSDNNITIGYAKNINFDTTQQNYIQLLEQKNKKVAITSNTVNMSGSTISYENSCISGKKSIHFEAQSNCELTNMLLDSEGEIFLKSDTYNLKQCFIDNAQFIQLESTSPDSLIKIINIKLSKDAPFRVIEGAMNLSKNSIPEYFVIIGAEKINILFDKKAFE